MEEKGNKSGYIQIKNARVHNLKGVDLDLPRNQMIVITGVSGSGKSSLAFDTLYAEGQRRYVESLSSYVRQFLGRMDKPEVDYIKGIPPAIAIEVTTLAITGMPLHLAASLLKPVARSAKPYLVFSIKNQ